MAALQNADGDAEPNAARRRLYDDLDARLGQQGLQIGAQL
jgi:hypothetical protein